MDFIDPSIEAYALEHSEKESDLLFNLNRQTHLKMLQPRMLSGHLQGRILSFLSSAIKPKYILEIGTYTGYSALCMAEGLSKNGKLVTIDKNIELETMVKKYINDSSYKNQIEFINADAIDVIPTLNLEWDLVFIDADKENYINYFDLVIDQVNKGGWIIADNVLWSGKVLKEPDAKDKETIILQKFNEKVNQDSRVRNVLFPVRDGMMLMIKN
ncbi:MAG: O-methyltransferase [Bacteroidota bacterium]|nr:O-methyltransferase [Bacteroidota bacterium]